MPALPSVMIPVASTISITLSPGLSRP